MSGDIHIRICIIVISQSSNYKAIENTHVMYSGIIASITLTLVCCRYLCISGHVHQRGSTITSIQPFVTDGSDEKLFPN